MKQYRLGQKSPLQEKRFYLALETALETAQTPEVKTAIESARVNMETKWKAEDEARERAKKDAVTADLTALKAGVPDAVMEAIQAAMEETPTTEVSAEKADTQASADMADTKQEMRGENVEKFVNAAKSILDEAKNRISGFIEEAKKIDLRSTSGWAIVWLSMHGALYDWAFSASPVISEPVSIAAQIILGVGTAVGVGTSIALFREEYATRLAKKTNTSQQ